MFTLDSKLRSSVAVVFLVVVITLSLGIHSYRNQQATEAKSAELNDSIVQNRVLVNDYDGDGMNDSADVCPTRPETPNGFEDGDGCPDVVATTGAS